MASSSSSLTPVVPSHPWKYDVFLSFRGEDTRKIFVDYLYSALLEQGIHTFKDDEALPQGESISPYLETAIKESQIVVIIFSQNYADSTWCLRELAYIMKCKDISGNTVLPIFYDVEPSTVRKQKQKYGEAFSKHELENKDNVESWRQALEDASNLSGWEIKRMANGHESKAVKEIVDTISRRLHPLTTSANEKLVGIVDRVQDLKSKLEIGLSGVRMIGIWGGGGAGKTTLALSTYSELSSTFDGCYFIENVPEKLSKKGLDKLQKKIISKVSKLKKREVKKVRGRWLPNDRLQRIRALIVLDNVDHLDQLRMLAGSHDWFGEGSRIIITTRDEHLLTAHKVNVIYNITLLNDDEAIKLLRNHAPRDNRPMKDYELICQDVVSYARGLPLALTVLGCFLCDKDIDEWRSTLVRLKEIPEMDIVETLKISYDGLKPVEQDLFLDIACFFRGEIKSERIIAMLDAFGFHPAIGLKVLVQKALITISKTGKCDMHDLVQEMGQYIVRGKHSKNPEKHSRVWMKQDVLKICAMDPTKELDIIEVIKFKSDNDGPINRLPPIVANLKNMRWFDWKGDLASTNFSWMELRCLRLEDILQEQLWNGYKHLPNLKIMELVGLKNLIRTPDFDGVPNLERFSLHKCPCLKEIGPSFERLQKLVFLSIERCDSLKMFPPISQLKKLEPLPFVECPELFKLLPNFFVSCWMCGNKEVTKPGDDLIDVEQCSFKDPCLSHNNHTQLRFLPTCLRKLELSYCNVGDEDISSAVWELTNVEKLILIGNNFTRLNLSVLRLARLKMLNVTECKDLVALSELPSGIAVVLADYCSSLESLGDISNCRGLWKVSAFGKNKLGPHFGDILLDSMLQGNALENHFISVRLQSQMIPKGFGGRMYKEKTVTMHLPDNWYNDFSGFLICVVTETVALYSINIVIKQEPDEDSTFVLWHASSEARDPKCDETNKYVGYVSFTSLRLLNLLDNNISFSIEESTDCFVGVELVPRKSKVDDEVQATDCSEFWDKEYEHITTFTIQHDSQSSINVLWRPVP